MGRFRSLFVPMDSNGSLWVFYRSLCVLMYYNESLWVLMDSYSSTRILIFFKSPYASFCVLIGPFASLCVFTGLYAFLWVLMGPCRS